MAEQGFLQDPNTSSVDVIGTLVLVPLVIIMGSGAFALSLSFWAPTAGSPAATAFAAFWAANSTGIAIMCGQSLIRSLRARRAADTSTDYQISMEAALVGPRGLTWRDTYE